MPVHPAHGAGVTPPVHGFGLLDEARSSLSRRPAHGRRRVQRVHQRQRPGVPGDHPGDVAGQVQHIRQRQDETGRGLHHRAQRLQRRDRRVPRQLVLPVVLLRALQPGRQTRGRQGVLAGVPAGRTGQHPAHEAPIPQAQQQLRAGPHHLVDGEDPGGGVVAGQVLQHCSGGQRRGRVGQYVAGQDHLAGLPRTHPLLRGADRPAPLLLAERPGLNGGGPAGFPVVAGWLPVSRRAGLRRHRPQEHLGIRVLRLAPVVSPGHHGRQPSTGVIQPNEDLGNHQDRGLLGAGGEGDRTQRHRPGPGADQRIAPPGRADDGPPRGPQRLDAIRPVGLDHQGAAQADESVPLVHPGADVLAACQQVDEREPLQCALGQLVGAEGQAWRRDPAVLGPHDVDPGPLLRPVLTDRLGRARAAWPGEPRRSRRRGSCSPRPASRPPA